MEEDNPQILEWMVPECPYRVTISAPVLNQIRILAVEAFYSVPRGGVEIGGAFFGMHDTESVHIRAFRPIRCQYSTGPSFTLSIQDQIGLSGVLEQAQTDPDLAGMVPLGWYHSHTRSDLFLSPQDLQLYNEFFPDRWQLALVLRPTNLQPTRAAFFYRDRRGAVKADTPAQQLILEPPTFGLKPAGLSTPLTPPPVANGTRERSAPAQPSPTSSVGKAQSSVATLSRPAEAKEAPPTLAAVSKPQTTQNLATAAAATAPALSVAPTAVAPAPEVGLPGFLTQTPAAPASGKRTLRILLGVLLVLLLCGAGAAAYLKWGTANKTAGLGLETYDINGAFLIRWDREASAIRNASRVVLEIQDGAEKTPIELAGPELNVGGYGYMRRTGQVSVHMKVEGSTPAEEYSNFSTSQSLGSQPASAPAKDAPAAKTAAEKEHLKTELINESIQTVDLRREIASLRRQLAEERARNSAPAPAPQPEDGVSR